MVGTFDVGKVRTMKQTYNWVIPSDFLHGRKVGDYLESAEFLTHSKNYKWKMRLYPGGCNKTCEDYFSIIIYYCGVKRVNAAISLSIINQDNENIAKNTLEAYEFGLLDYRYYNRSSFSKFIKRNFVMDQNNKIIVNGKLIIQFKVAVNPGNNTSKNLKRKLDQIDVNLQQLLKIQKLENLMDDKEYSDITFLLDGKTFKAHKCILAKESPVFDVMFKTDMIEKQLNEVIIEDIRPDIFEKMLRYMYVGEVKDIQTTAIDLLAAADKYAMDELKFKCGQSLIDNLSIDSAVESLVTTDRYHMKQFKATIIQFITSHSADIVQAPSFKLLTDIPHVLYEVCQAVGMKK